MSVDFRAVRPDEDESSGGKANVAPRPGRARDRGSRRRVPRRPQLGPFEAHDPPRHGERRSGRPFLSDPAPSPLRAPAEPGDPNQSGSPLARDERTDLRHRPNFPSASNPRGAHASRSCRTKQHQRKRRADAGVTDADRQLGRTTMGAGDDIGRHHERGPPEAGAAAGTRWSGPTGAASNAAR